MTQLEKELSNCKSMEEIENKIQQSKGKNRCHITREQKQRALQLFMQTLDSSTINIQRNLGYCYPVVAKLSDCLNQKVKFVVLDIETNGLKDDAEIIKLDLTTIRNGKIIKTLSSTVKNKTHIPLPVKKLTGVSRKDLQTAISQDKAKSIIKRHCRNAVIVGFNMPFICKHATLPSDAQTIDCLQIAKARLKGKIKLFTSKNILEYYNVSTTSPTIADLFLILWKGD